MAMKDKLGNKERSVVTFSRIVFCLLMVWSHANYFFSLQRFPSKSVDGFVPLVTSEKILPFLFRFITYPIAPGFFFMAGLLLGINTFLGKNYSLSFFLKKSFYCLFFGVFLNYLGFGGELFEFEVLYCFAILFLMAPLLRKMPKSSQLLLAACCLILSQVLSQSFGLGLLNFLMRIFILGGGASYHVQVIFPVAGWLGIFLIGHVIGQKGFYQKLLNFNKLFFWGVLFIIVFFLTKISELQSAVLSGSIWDFAQIFVANKIPPRFDFVALGFCSLCLVFGIGLLLSRKESWQNIISSKLHIDALDWYVIHLLILLAAKNLFHVQKTSSFLLVFLYFILTSLLTYFLVRLNMKMKRTIFVSSKNEK